VKWWMIWPKILPKIKQKFLHAWRRGRRKTWTKHKGEGSFRCHDQPTLCLLWMVQVGKVILKHSQNMDQKNFDRMPSYIEFVGKRLKIKDNYEVWCWLSVEVLACSIDHLGVIKFLCHPRRGHGGIPMAVKHGHA
jgi:hypothetical protein